MMERTPAYKPAFFWFTLFALIWSTFLLFAGGFTTSIQAGMAFLDWPLSNGSLNPQGWMEEPDQLAEHSHRLLGMKLGLLAIVIFAWAQWRESRRWVRGIALALLATIIFQGLLGGLRVLLDSRNIQTEHNLIAQSFAVAHACGAQVVFCLLITIVLATSRSWTERHAGLNQVVPSDVRLWGIVACAALFIQVLLGAVMRHGGAGLAIPTFPLTPEGTIFPGTWNFGISIHFAHRAWAIGVTVILLVFLTKLWNRDNTRRAFMPWILGVMFGLVLQIYLGALTIWTVKNPHAATFHMLGGAFLLGGTYALTFLSHRLFSSKDQLAGPEARPQPATQPVI